MATPRPIGTAPARGAYDVVIIGGAMMGSSAAWWLSNNADFDGSILVVERDPTYEQASTTGTASCIRHQFSHPLNVRIGEFATEFIRNFKTFIGDDDAPEIRLLEFGYLYLSDGAHDARHIENQKTQAALGAATRILTPEEIAAKWPFFRLDGITLGSWNGVGEGWFDGATIFETYRRKAREAGVEYVTNEAVAMSVQGGRVRSVTLKSGERVACGRVINASGPRAALTARMAGIEIPVEPRKRCTFIFDAAEPLDVTMPLTITPRGVHCRVERQYYQAGSVPKDDSPPDHDDFEVDYSEFDDDIWPTLAHWIPQFEAIKLIRGWACHYAMNTLDHNLVVGPHPEVTNFLFMNGFSGHGLQQNAAVGRAISELVACGEFRTLDLGELGFERIVSGTPFLEKAII